jgi:hypothetical protein
MFVETPDSSLRRSDLFDFSECPRPDPRGISETPTEAEAEVRQIVVRATAGRTVHAAGEA